MDEYDWLFEEKVSPQDELGGKTSEPEPVRSWGQKKELAPIKTVLERSGVRFDIAEPDFDDPPETVRWRVTQPKRTVQSEDQSEFESKNRRRGR